MFQTTNQIYILICLYIYIFIYLLIYLHTHIYIYIYIHTILYLSSRWIHNIPQRTPRFLYQKKGPHDPNRTAPAPGIIETKTSHSKVSHLPTSQVPCSWVRAVPAKSPLHPVRLQVNDLCIRTFHCMCSFSRGPGEVPKSFSNGK